MDGKLILQVVAPLFLIAGAVRAEPPAPPVPATVSAAPAPAIGKQASVTVELTVVEFNLTKIRALGFNWDLVPGGKPTAEAPDVMISKFATSKQFDGFLKALRQHDIATVLSEPQIMTLSGRPAQVRIGEEALQLDVNPIILESGRIQVEHRLQLAHSGRELKSESSVEVESGQAVIANKMRREQKDAKGKVNEIETLVILRATTGAPDRQAAAGEIKVETEIR